MSVLFSRVIQGCFKASCAVYLIDVLNFVSLWKRLEARGERCSGKRNWLNASNDFLYLSVVKSSES